MGRKRQDVVVCDIIPKFLSAAQAKKYLDCGDDFLQKLRDNNEIRFSRYGKKNYWYDLNSLENFLERNRVN